MVLHFEFQTLNLFKMFIKKIIFTILIFITSLTCFGNFALAAVADEQVGMEEIKEIGLEDTDPRVIVARVVRVFIGFLGIVALILIIYAGFVIMMSEGDDSKIQRGKDILKSATIGLIIVMSSFGIASLVISMLMVGTGIGGSTGPSSTGYSGYLSGSGASMDNIIKYRYPEHNQKDVPRNVNIMITFREEMATSSIMKEEDGKYKIKESNIRIFKSDVGDSCDGGTGVDSNGTASTCETTNITDVNVLSDDAKTFILNPVNHLGSESSKVEYTILLISGDDGILKKNQEKGFTKDERWSFEVSTKIDLTPPIVKNVWPLPDNEQDVVDEIGQAVHASGTIEVLDNESIKILELSTTTITAESETNKATFTENSYYNCDTLIENNDNFIITANKTEEYKIKAKPPLASGADLSDGEAYIGCGLTITINPSNLVDGNNGWKITLKPERKSDTLTVGDIKYNFVSNNPANKNEIKVTDVFGPDTIKSAIENHPDNEVVATTEGSNIVKLKAKIAGTAGNNIELKTTATTSAITLNGNNLTGGKDIARRIRNIDKNDNPKNTTIRINFNDEINPMTIAGLAADVQDYIKIINAKEDAEEQGEGCSTDADCKSFKCEDRNNDGTKTCQGDNDYLEGEFIISNQYHTIEFQSDIECGRNSCGEQIYCLPENSHLRVELTAANLETCDNLDNCESTSPFNTCSNDNDATQGNCQNANHNYPLSKLPFDGIMDNAFNSLDGDKDNNAEGPTTDAAYNQNTESGQGDNFQWSFFINDEIERDAPIILSTKIEDTEVNHGSSSPAIDEPIKIEFNKLMMSSSLGTRPYNVTSADGIITHQRIQLENYTGDPLYYYVTSRDRNSAIVDESLSYHVGNADRTVVSIKHTNFEETESYKVRVGSGIKDIYQNCFNPSGGPNCSGQDGASCCSGVWKKGKTANDNLEGIKECDVTSDATP